MTWKTDFFARSIGIAVACSLFAASGRAQTAEGRAAPVQATGSAFLSRDNLPQAKADAVSAALASAVAAAATEFISKDVFSANREVLVRWFSEKPRAFVQEYRILRESRPTPATLEVLVAVSPHKRKLKEELTRTGVLFERTRRPTLGWESFAEAGAGKKPRVSAYSLGWMKRITDRLTSLGYDVNPNGPGDIALSGAVSALAGRTVSFEITTRFPVSKAENAPVSAGFGASDDPDTVAGILALKVLSQSLGPWSRMAGGGLHYEVTVTGMKSFGTYEELRQALNSGVSGVTAAAEAVYSPGSVTFEVVFDGEPAALQRALAAVRIKGTAPRVTSAGDRSLRMELPQ